MSLENLKTVKCIFNGCDVRFESKEKGEDHVRQVHVEEVICPYENCGIRLKSLNLKLHVKSKHSRKCDPVVIKCNENITLKRKPDLNIESESSKLSEMEEIRADAGSSEQIEKRIKINHSESKDVFLHVSNVEGLSEDVNTKNGQDRKQTTRNKNESLPSWEKVTCDNLDLGSDSSSGSNSDSSSSSDSYSD